MGKVTDLALKQEKEMYELGKRHGAVEALMELKGELLKNSEPWYIGRLDGKAEDVIGYEAAERIINKQIKKLKGGKE